MNRSVGPGHRPPHRDLPVGVGAGRLSDEAEARLARPPVAPLRPPAMTDADAVVRWRDEIHRGWLDGDPPAAACGHREASIGGVRCLVADGPHDAPLVVYLHGGGFALGSPEVALPITDRLRRWAGIVSIDYRLAPEHPFPAAVDDVRTVVGELAGDTEHRPLVLAGDSAGAALAATGGLAGRAHVAALVLLSPHVDLVPPATRSRRIDPSSDVDDVTASWLRRAYCGDRSPAHPDISPLRADLAALPPTLIQVGAIDSSLRQAIRFARLARHAGAEVCLDVWDGLWHAWHYHRELPEAHRAIDEAGRFVRRCARRTDGC